MQALRWASDGLGAVSVAALVLAFAACGSPQASSPLPPSTGRRDGGVELTPADAGASCEVRFERTVCDPDRWLESLDSPEVLAWLRSRDQDARRDRSADPVAVALQARVEDIWKNWKYVDDSASVQKKKAAKESPSLRSKDGRIEWVRGKDSRTLFEKLESPQTFGAHDLSPEGTFALVERVTAGRDRREFLVRRAQGNTGIDVLIGIEGSEVVWDGKRGGFYYTFTPADVANAVRFGARQIRFHRVGTSQELDPLVVPANNDRNGSSGTNPLALLTDDLLLIRSKSAWDGGHRFAIVDLAKAPPTSRELTQDGGAVEGVDVDGKSLLVIVRGPDATRMVRRLSAEDAKAGASGQVLRTIAASEHYASVKIAGHYTVFEFGAGHAARFEICDKNARPIMGWTGKPGDTESVFASGSELRVKRGGLLALNEIARLEPERGLRTPLQHAVSTWDPTLYQVDALEAVSADGTRIPIEVLRRKDLPASTTSPLRVYGYGGFQYSQFLGFQAIVAAWVESGGLYAVVHARGGLEWGREWNAAALRKDHFRSVEDIGGSLRALHRGGYGSPATTLVHGRSHGGLVVSRAAIEWPDAVRMALAEVPLVDMIRFVEKGRGGVTEYGDPDDAGEFPSLLHLSANHAVRPGGRYPAFFVTTAIGDERVDAMHPAKLVAALERASADNRVLLRVDWKGGHLGGGGAEAFEKPMAEALGWLRAMMAK